MGKSKIDWCDNTWNPITGCRHNCPYCYARKMTARFSGDVRTNMMAKTNYRTEAAPDGSGDLYILDEAMKNEIGNTVVYPFRFEPTYHRYRLDGLSHFKNGCNVFVGAMADIFGKWVPDAWINEILAECVKNSVHNYLFLTKNPRRYRDIDLPAGENMWYGTTITNEAELSRLEYLPAGRKTFVSIEPIMNNINAVSNIYIFRERVGWIIIGAQTGSVKNKVIPEQRWINDIVEMADNAHIPVFMKDSLTKIMGEDDFKREFPPQLLRKNMSRKRMEINCGNCAGCNAFLKKKDMTMIFCKERRGRYGSQLGYLCGTCYEKLRAFMNIKEDEKG